MSLHPEDWPRVREVFERALALTAAERLEYLAAACGSNRPLRDQVERMLDSHERAAGFLSTPAAALVDEPSAVESLEGQRIGPYLLSRRVGAGGMGVVYKARDTRLDRTVAIKVLPSEVAGDVQARERFDRVKHSRPGWRALPLSHALHVAAQVASALDKAHRAGIVHRDLKPGELRRIAAAK